MFPKRNDLRIAATILHFKNAPQLVQVIDAVLKQTLSVDKVIVLDNNSEIDLSGYIEKYTEVDFIMLKENMGVGYGHNHLWKHAIEKYNVNAIWALEHDAVPDHDNLLKVLDGVYSNPQFDSIYAANSIECSSLEYDRFIYYDGYFPFFRKISNPTKREDYFGGLSFNGVLIPVSTISAIGYLNEQLFVGYEDRDFHRRILNHHGKILRITNTCVHHDLYKNRKKLVIGNKCFLLSNSTIEREYYSFRNAMWIDNNHASYAIRLFLSIVATILFKKQKIRRIKVKIMAYRDARHARMGQRIHF